MNETEGGFTGVTRDDIGIVTGDIRLTGVGLDRVHWHRFGNFNERGYVEFQLLGLGYVYIDDMQSHLTKIAESEELVFETIASIIPTEIAFSEVVWMSDFRANIWMANKFGESSVRLALHHFLPCSRYTDTQSRWVFRGVKVSVI
ncbi:hypothetical protein BDR04DRAFT_1164449 [Suillus decipiens]|nr:hypothetical protein BDR04DRAFT_1164449 [Suillus decipiens]